MRRRNIFLCVCFGVLGNCHSREGGNPLLRIMQYYVYILSSQKNGTLYIGVTSDLVKRVHQHKDEQIEGFSKKYKVHSLVYFEQTNNVIEALRREKQLKKWNRQWKINLIEKVNPDWLDLYDTII